MDEELYYDDEYYLDELDNCCHTCGGSGWVESLAEERCDWLNYADKPATCPNCGGTGLAKDCTYF